MIDPRFLMRAKLWVQNPPSAKRVKFVLGVLAIALIIVGIEYFGFWPDWARAERFPRRL